MPVALITGCSSGFGEAIAVAFAQRDYQVVATMRKPESAPSGLKTLATERAADVVIAPLDVTSPAMRKAAIDLTIQRFGRTEDNTFEIILVGLDTEVRRALEAKLGVGQVESIPAVESVGAKAGKELRDDGVKSLLAAILFIMVYIAVRFDFRYGPGTVASLLHDAIIIMGAFAVTYKEFSLTTIAAILTVIGYSMNDTIVVFDRVRENLRLMRKETLTSVLNLSINQTLSRTIMTSGMTFLSVFALFVFGGEVLNGFSFALTVGIIIGTYSSIGIASPIVDWWYKSTEQKAKKKTA